MEELGPAVMADDQGHPFGRRPTGAPEVIDWPADFAAELAREKEDSGEGSTHSGETEIKLDLARAYLAMDDKDGARSILEEILKTAQGEQKSEAERLLASLA